MALFFLGHVLAIVLHLLEIIYRKRNCLFSFLTTRYFKKYSFNYWFYKTIIFTIKSNSSFSFFFNF